MKPTPSDFLKHFVEINKQGEFIFNKEILKHFPSRKQQAEAWAQEILKAALSNLMEAEKKKAKKK